MALLDTKIRFDPPAPMEIYVGGGHNTANMPLDNVGEHYHRCEHRDTQPIMRFTCGETNTNRLGILFAGGMTWNHSLNNVSNDYWN